MSHEYLLKDVMVVINGEHTYLTATTRYHVNNSNILQVAITLESIKEQQDTPLVESYNQQ